MKILTRAGHLTDEALLLMNESGLSHRDLRHAERHLLSCPACRVHAQTLLHTGGLDFLNDDLPLPAADAARDRLQARLEAAAEASPAPRWIPEPRGYLQPRMWLRLGAVAALLILAATFQATRPLQDRLAAYEETGPEPNRALTPGSAHAVQIAELCSKNDNELDPPVSPEKAQAVFRAYGMSDRAARAYQVDYLINPQLGGDDAIENLWPEPYGATVWNATAKDALEARLHGMVCAQQIDLGAAQQELATDWIGAYKKYFHTRRPVRTVAAADSRSVLP